MKPTVRRAHRVNSKLLISCASLAIAAVTMAPQKARADAFNGSFTPTPDATRSNTGTGTETITVNSSATTLNWTATDNNFLPNGNTATFTSNVGVTDYTVLNKVTPADGSNPIQLNGHVISTLEGNSSAIGGNVWFYAPSGIVVGSGAVFDVGGLLLTSLTPNLISNSANGFNASFSKQTGDGGPITMGGQVNALQQNSYVALVAPRVVQSGTVKVDGSAAYVAAESLTMTMNQGLFDIQVDLGGGTDDDQGVVHSGSTTGGDDASLSDNHKIYMVAVPKNQALTMLLGGTAGFDAGVAGYENGQIVLTTGYNLHDLEGDLNYSYNSSVDDAGSMQIDPGTYLSDLVAISNGSIYVGADDGGIDFKGDVTLNSIDPWDGGSITLNASNGNTLNVDGDVTMYSQNTWYQPDVQLKVATDVGASITIGGNLDMKAQFYPGYGGSAQIDAYGGTISVGGDTIVNMDGIDDPENGYGDERRGGTINISASDADGNQGSFTTGDLTLSANAVAHDNSGSEDWQLVDALGGVIDMNPSQGGEITVNGNLDASANATGGQQLALEQGPGGEGRAGEIHIGAPGGTLTIDGTVTANANGTGGAATAGVDGGAGYGGIVDVYSAGSGVVSIGGNILLSANGVGGTGQNGGVGTGGHAGVGSTGGSVTLGGDTYAGAEGTGGNATAGFGGAGGAGIGGVAYIEADSSEGGTAGSITGSTATISSNAHGGSGGQGDGDTIGAGSGGSATGGQFEGFDTGGSFALADINGGYLSLTVVNLTSTALGGVGGVGGTGQVGGNGGDALGGHVEAGTWNSLAPGAPIDTSGSAQFTDVSANASATGGDGGAGDGASEGNGGNGTGGAALFVAEGDTQATTVTLNADGSGGDGATGGDGFGGSGDAGGTLLLVDDNANMTVTGDINLSSVGYGGDSTTDDAGDGYGGDSAIVVNAGGRLDGGMDLDDEIIPSGEIFIDNRGKGGAGWNGTLAGSGGDGEGGNSTVIVDGSLAAGNFTVLSRGVGGGGGTASAGTGGSGGSGHGGNNVITVGDNGLMDVFAFTAFANAQGGNGGSGTAGSGIGGFAEGGTNIVTIDGTANAVGCDDCGPDDAILGFVATAYAQGGNGQDGGSAQGGSSSITVNGSLTSGTLLQASGRGTGGTGADYGGGANGGTASITINGDVSAASVVVATDATGGNATNYDGGTAHSGAATLALQSGSLTADNVSVQTMATGGNSTTGNGGDAYGSRPSELEGFVPGGATFNTIAGIATLGGTLTLDAHAQGGTGSTGGYGEGGAVSLSVGAGSTLSVTGESDLFATGGGGQGSFNESGTGGVGGNGQGGLVLVDIHGDATTGDFTMRSSGFGGNGGDGVDGGSGGTGAAGSSTLTVYSGGTLDSADILIRSLGFGGNGGDGSTGVGGDGGDAFGGDTNLNVIAGGSLTATSYTGVAHALNGFDTANDEEFGGNGGSGDAGIGAGGDAQSGTTTAQIDGTVAVDDFFHISAFAQGGDGSTGGDATAGSASLTVNGSLTAGGRVQSSAQALGGIGENYGG
ncbi:MAG TPA: hypothetical protein VHM21_06580, partial [Sphingomicrobium sp.]|nr:hypothetical protein [Sphingomicrobium sp.]